MSEKASEGPSPAMAILFSMGWAVSTWAGIWALRLLPPGAGGSSLGWAILFAVFVMPLVASHVHRSRRVGIWTAVWLWGPSVLVMLRVATLLRGL